MHAGVLHDHLARTTSAGFVVWSAVGGALYVLRHLLFLDRTSMRRLTLLAVLCLALTEGSCTPTPMEPQCTKPPTATLDSTGHGTMVVIVYPDWWLKIMPLCGSAADSARRR